MVNNKEVPSHCLNCNAYEKSLFCSMNEQYIDDLSKRKVTNIYRKGVTLFFEGNPNYGIFEVCEGKVKVTKTTSNGNTTIVDVASEGEIIGLDGLNGKQLYTTTATALEDSVVCFIDKVYFKDKVLIDEKVQEGVIDRLSKYVHYSQGRIASLSQKSVRERLAELLLELSETYGVKEGDNDIINFALNREEMASMIGVAKETLIRTLSDFKEEGLIDQKDKLLYVKNKLKLNEYAFPR